MEIVKEKDQKIINLDCVPHFIYVLPNGNPVIAGNKDINIFDPQFKLIKTVDKINNKPFVPSGITSNGTNYVYITINQEKIFQTDLDFNFIKQIHTQGIKINDLFHQNYDVLSGTAFFENTIFICNQTKKRIQKIRENSLFEEAYPLNFKPLNIAITKNTACISPASESFLSFYNLNPFSFKLKINEFGNSIIAINSWIYAYDKLSTRIRCYDINGYLAQEKNLEIPECFNGNMSQDHSIAYLNKKLMICSSKTKKSFIVIKFK